MSRRVLLGIVLIFIVLAIFCCSRKLTQEQKALRLVKDSYALGGNISVADNINKWLKTKGDMVKPFGWEAEKKDENIYLVHYRYKIYSFTEGIGERGYFFEVDLVTKVVRNVTSEYLKKYEPLSLPFKSEKEVMEETLEESDFLKKIE
ncbi:hypothetical protein ACFL7M_12755 [Thermodesulfobacteriota bacterium]